MLQVKNIPEGILGQNLQKNISKYIISQDKYIDNQLKALKICIWKHFREV